MERTKIREKVIFFLYLYLHICISVYLCVFVSMFYQKQRKEAKVKTSSLIHPLDLYLYSYSNLHLYLYLYSTKSRARMQNWRELKYEERSDQNISCLFFSFLGSEKRFDQRSLISFLAFSLAFSLAKFGIKSFLFNLSFKSCKPLLVIILSQHKIEIIVTFLLLSSC